MVLSEEEDTQLLTQIGLTKTQAKLYLALLKLEEADGKTLSKKANVPRQEVYRTLGELQERGLVEKVITSPHKFKATPIEFGLQILMIQRFQQFKDIQEKTKELIRKIQSYPIEKPQEQEQEYKLIMVEGKERLLQIIKDEHDSVQQSVDILSTFPRWLQILDSCFEDYEKALARKVKYRVVIDKPEGRIDFPENVRALLAEPSFKLRLSRGPLETNAAIFDGKQATFNFLPSKSLAESPIIWTDHPSFISMAHDQFEKVWRSAQEYKLENKNS
jgi:sugar-specific transcriptional regulator TrmB